MLVFQSLSTNKLLVVTTVYEFQIVEAYVCQSFQTLYEASPIINVTQRSFSVFHPITYVTNRSFAAFSGYTIHILYYAGVSIMPPRVLASGPKPCGGNNLQILKLHTSLPRKNIEQSVFNQLRLVRI